MILDRGGRWAVSSLGWADRSSFVVADLAERRWRAVPVTGPAQGYVSVHGGRGDVFAVQHHDAKGSTARVALHRFDDPDTEVASVALDPDAGTGAALFAGDAAQWPGVPALYVTRVFSPGSRPEYVLISIAAERGVVTTHQMKWFDGSFDHGYQAPTGVVQVPGDQGALAAVSVARDDRLFLHDLSSDELLRDVRLNGGNGAQTPVFSADGTQAWTIDYDTAVFLDTGSWTVRRSLRLQRPDREVAMFVGPPTPTADESLCVIARPGSGDVLGVATESCRVTVRAQMERQPLEAAASLDGTVFARDWHSGAPLWGRWQPV